MITEQRKKDVRSIVEESKPLMDTMRSEAKSEDEKLVVEIIEELLNIVHELTEPNDNNRAQEINTDVNAGQSTSDQRD